MSNLVKRPAKSEERNLAFLTLLVAGSMVKLWQVVKSTPLRFVLANTEPSKSQFTSLDFERSAWVKSAPLILQLMKVLLFSFLFQNWCNLKGIFQNEQKIQSLLYPRSLHQSVCSQ